MLSSLVALMTLPALTVGALPAEAATPVKDGSVLVGCIYKATASESAVKRADGNYAINDGNLTAAENDADFIKMKDKLNKDFEYMFNLKADIEKMQQLSNMKWDEYYALRDAYNKEFKKIVAAWVTGNHYE